MSIRHLTHLVEIADTLPAPVAEWVRDGFRRYLAGEPLESALGLAAKPGQRRPATRLRTEQRNAELRAAWQLTAGDSPWSKSVNLAIAIGRLTPIYRASQVGRVPESSRNAALCRARQHGTLPTKPRRIHSICAQSATAIHCARPVDNATYPINRDA